MIATYIALGSNLDQPLLQLQLAVRALRALPTSRLVHRSSIYRSAPVGPGEQPDYLNAAVRLDTRLDALALLDHLQRIERAQGRTRGTRWGPRTLDLDLLFYGDLIRSDVRLTLPHPRLHERNFVLYPLREISDTSRLPDGTDLDTLLARCQAGVLENTGEALGDA